MKRSIKGFFVILAIVMSFVLVQGVCARENIVLTTFEGVVTSDTSADDRTIGIDEDGDNIIDVMIYHMGPSWYWDDENISYPVEGESLKIVASYCEILGDYVGVSVYDSEGKLLIELRDIATLRPLWNQNAKTTDLSDTSTEATGDCCPDCPDGGDCEPIPNNYNYLSPGPHGK